ncbi:hypothetical protein PTSG_08156 [Salpingoeca rosetta]|uniref:MIT domain-containing protein n=1 Tax=Salpingoeca rosetta (strain ATCC 50818 / BSB-021) TaxID=946362 RepID=F2UI57_SALR5|nr:uncharacterized protein PTSG_08156 [Salpingoeca rosetta]EGD76806.1 hypothetical protein PTSG_08156 [Salpingoeca rosetta]|eukprot:XP_004991178.1 hypothetical protein PTSG_08156 [Salpingoeca rosetta]
MDDDSNRDGGGGYVRAGAAHIKVGMGAEAAGDVMGAYDAFVKGVTVLLEGGRTDTNARRRKAVHDHLVEYLDRLERLSAQVATMGDGSAHGPGQRRSSRSSESSESSESSGHRAQPPAVGGNAHTNTGRQPLGGRTGSALLPHRRPPQQLPPGSLSSSQPLHVDTSSAPRPSYHRTASLPDDTAPAHDSTPPLPAVRPPPSLSSLARTTSLPASTPRATSDRDGAARDSSERAEQHTHEGGTNGGEGGDDGGVGREDEDEEEEEEVGSKSVQALLDRGKRVQASVRDLLRTTTTDLKREAQEARGEQERLKEDVIDPLSRLFDRFPDE